LVSRMGITVEDFDPLELPSVIKSMHEAYIAANEGVDDEKMREDLDIITESLVGYSQQKVMRTERILEAVGRAQRDGVKVVIDEFNYLPAETLASLNEILSSKDNAEGFGVIFTGNIGADYLKRQGLDPAFVNRILSGVVDYDYPPQDIDLELSRSILDNETFDSGVDVPDRELFQIALTQLVDTRGYIDAPVDAFNDVWDFTRAVSLLQKLSSGEQLRDIASNSGAVQGVTAIKLSKIKMSFRNMNQVIREWKLDGYSQPLENYIFKDIVEPAAALDRKEAAELMYIFREWGGFFQGDEWDQVDVDSVRWSISGIDKMRNLGEDSEPLERKLFSAEEIVRAVSGVELPEMKDGDEIVVVDEAERREQEKIIAEMDSAIERVKGRLEKFPLDFDEFCKAFGSVHA